jgi:hypothetical protein
MARFILDVANCDKEKTQMILYSLLEDTFLARELTRIVLIDETNKNQFFNNELDNALSDEQIQNYNTELKILST